MPDKLPEDLSEVSLKVVPAERRKEIHCSDCRNGSDILKRARRVCPVCGSKKVEVVNA